MPRILKFVWLVSGIAGLDLSNKTEKYSLVHGSLEDNIGRGLLFGVADWKIEGKGFSADG